jgi:hypothetical protein
VRAQTNSVRQVFISHAEEDANFANLLADDLRRNGMQVWIASDSILPGEDWPDAINRGLSGSSHTVIVLTPAAMDSLWVQKEMSVAIMLERQGRMKVIPLQLKPCEVPPLSSSYQMILLRRGYEAGLSQLLQVLGLSIMASDRVPPSRQEPHLKDRVRKLADESAQSFEYWCFWGAKTQGFDDQQLLSDWLIEKGVDKVFRDYRILRETIDILKTQGLKVEQILESEFNELIRQHDSHNRGL